MPLKSIPCVGKMSFATRLRVSNWRCSSHSVRLPIAPGLPLPGNKCCPDANEQGLKDTVRAAPNAVTRIVVKFGPYTGKYVYHCHILEHEDMDMMRPFLIVPRDLEVMGSSPVTTTPGGAGTSRAAARMAPVSKRTPPGTMKQHGR